MKTEMLTEIKSVLKEVISEKKLSFPTPKPSKHWYQKRKSFLDQNEEFLTAIIDHIKVKYQHEYSQEELFLMQKLYLLYPHRLPKKLLSLSWKHIKILLNIYAENKRDFYIDLCFARNWQVEVLKEYIVNDLYEKYMAILAEIADYQEVKKDDFMDHFLEIQTFIYEEC